MRLLVYAAAPLVAGAGLWVGFALRGRAPKRYSINAVIGLLLLAYFGVTAGLGLFWVARQELPVFDPHYVFGYLTIALVAVHVTVNARQLLKYASKKSSRVAAPRESGERGKPLRLLGALGLLVAFGGVCFWVGKQRSSMTVVTSAGSAAQLPAPTAPETSLLPLPTAAIEQMVTSGKAETSVATFYHVETIAPREIPVASTHRPESYKSYPEAQTIPLPKDFVRTRMATATAVDSARRPVQALYPKAVSLKGLSTILQMTDGLTGPGRDSQRVGALGTRSAPSAGALYPTDVYVLASNVEGLAQGIYYYDVRNHALILVNPGDHMAELSRASSSPHLIRGAAFTLILTTEYFRTSFKYGVRSYRFSLLDAGHIAENAILAAEYQGLAARPMGRFDDRRVNALVQVNPAQEAALLLLPVGQRVDDEGTIHAEWSFVSAPLPLDSADVPPLITLVHGRTMLATGATSGALVRPFPKLPPLAPRDGETTVALPKATAAGDDLFATVEARRTMRNWTAQGMTVEQLSTVLKTSLGSSSAGLDPSTEEHRGLREYVIVLRVRGLPPGVYSYDANSHALHLRKAGQFKTQVFAAVQQTSARDADAVIVHTADTARLPYPDGARGYRYAAVDAGMAGERLYLATVSLGLGTGGMGSFKDDTMAEVLGLSGRTELLLYLSAIGAVPEKKAD